MASGFAWAPPAAALRPRTQLERVIVHRIKVSAEDPAFADDIEGTLAFFHTHPIGRAATGGAMPYPLVVGAEGMLWQCQRLLAQTPHAARFNPTSIGVAVVGDFRAEAPTPGQYTTLVAVLGHLTQTLAWPVERICGHDELPGASRQADKICPGAHLGMPALRRAVEARRRRGPVHAELAW